MTTPTRLTTALGDRHRIERELGAGGMATVYLARDLKHDREVKHAPAAYQLRSWLRVPSACVTPALH